MIVGFSIFIGVTVRAYRVAPPVPDRVIGPSGQVIFTGDDFRSGQQIFLKYGLMENGSLLGHGAYHGPDFSAVYLHALGQFTAATIAIQRYGQSCKSLDAPTQAAVQAEVILELKQNPYDAHTGMLTYTQPEVDTFQSKQTVWADYLLSVDRIVNEIII